jgi:hypothetical protein
MGLKGDDRRILAWARFLDDEGFSVDNVRSCCRKAALDQNLDPYKFTIAKFMSYEKPSRTKDETAMMDWDMILSHARRGRTVVNNISEVGQAALKAIGGIKAIGDSDEKGLQFLRKNFLEAAKVCSKGQEDDLVQLPSGKYEKALAIAGGLTVDFDGHDDGGNGPAID